MPIEHSLDRLLPSSFLARIYQHAREKYEEACTAGVNSDIQERFDADLLLRCMMKSG